MGLAKEKRGHFLYCLFCPKEIFYHMCFISMYSVLNTISEYTYFTYQKHYLIHFSACFENVEILQCILNVEDILILFHQILLCYLFNYPYYICIYAFTFIVILIVIDLNLSAIYASTETSS